MDVRLVPSLSEKHGPLSCTTTGILLVFVCVVFSIQYLYNQDYY